MNASRAPTPDLPLRGISLVQLCTLPNVTIAGWALSQLGCEVLRVGLSTGGLLPEPVPWHEGTRWVDLDIREDQAVADLLHEVDGSFLLIDALAEAQLNEAGITVSEIENRARGLVRVADDAQAGTDSLTDAAMSALAGLSAFQATRPGQPSAYEFPVLGTLTGLLAAVALTAQMAEDTPSRPAESITVSRASVAALLTGLVGTTSAQPPPGSAAVKVRDPKGRNPAYRVYETTDGWVCVTCTNPDFYARFCIALSLESLLADPRFEHAPWGVPREHQPILTEAFGTAISVMTTDECIDLFTSFDVPAQPVQTLSEYLTTDLVIDNNFIVPGLERPTIRLPVSLDGKPIGGRRSESNDIPTVAVKPNHEGRPLEGLLVADFSSYLAGPVCATLLSDLGASVVKVEPLAGEGLRSSGLSCLGINRNKRGLAVDLTTVEGAQVGQRLTSRADIVITGFRPGVAARLGLDHANLVERNPGIVSVSIDGYGAHQHLAQRPSFDPLLQALSGQMNLQGRTVDHPVFFAISLNDFVAGFLAAAGTLSLLRRKGRTGSGGEFAVTQAGAALLLLADEVMGVSPKAAEVATGTFVRAADEAWAHVEGSEQSLRHWLGREGNADIFESELKLEDLLSSAPSTVCATPVEEPFPENPDRPLFNELAWRYSHPYFGAACSAGRALRRAADEPLVPGPYIGEHSTEVLRTLGFSEDEIAHLFQAGVVASPAPPW